MNSPPWSWPPLGELRGCDGDGCASARDTWPLYHVYRRRESCRLCCSCILLSHRSLYCCCCFLLITSPSSYYDDGNSLTAPPGPTVTCDACRDAVAHLGCLYPANGGIFFCPACSAAEEGRPFTYAPRCGVPLDDRDGRVIMLAGRLALTILQRNAAVARAEATRLAGVAADAQRKASLAISVVHELDRQEPPWYFDPEAEAPPAAGPENNRSTAPEQGGETKILDAPPPPHHLAASEEGNQANAEDAMPSMAALTIGTRGAATAAAMAPAGHTPPWSWSRPPTMPPFGANDAAESSNARSRTLNLFGVTGMAMAAAEAARGSPPAPRTLQLFPAGEASASPKMPRALQLFEDEIPDAERRRCNDDAHQDQA